LRQHGVHLGIKPNFEIYAHFDDRKAVLKDALRYKFNRSEHNDFRLLASIDELKARLISPEQAMQYLRDKNEMEFKTVKRIAEAYRLYENKLHQANALDFNSLIFHAFQLLNYSALVRHYQTVYRYWLIDEFQDTNTSQYTLLWRMAGDTFSQLFAVADDDQTIYEWNGANVYRIRNLIKDFQCKVIQLTDNFRCPPRIVEASNRLLVYNVLRDSSKQTSEAVKNPSKADVPVIQYRIFSTDKEEISGISEEIVNLNPSQREHTAVLARNRTILQTIQNVLKNRNIHFTFLGRQHDFLSPQMRWLVACLKQINRPLDRRNMAVLIKTFQNFADMIVNPEDLISRSKTDQVNLLTAWIDTVRKAEYSTMPAVETIAGLASGSMGLSAAIKKVINFFEHDDTDDDFKDDLNAWHRIE